MKLHAAALTALVAIQPVAGNALTTTRSIIESQQIDSYDRVASSLIGNHLAPVTIDRQDSSEVGPRDRNVDMDVGGLGTITAHAQSGIGALHVATHAYLAAGLTDGVRSVRTFSTANWYDALNFTSSGLSAGYAIVEVLVTGALATSATGGDDATAPFAQSQAQINLTSTYYDAAGDATYVSTGMLSGQVRNVADRSYTSEVGDGDHYDPTAGLYFTDGTPMDADIHQYLEEQGPPNVETIFPFTGLTGHYLWRVPYYNGRTTNLQLSISCLSIAGAIASETASSDCDIGHSLYWGGIKFYTDLDGHRIDGVSVTSESGFDYTRSFFDQGGHSVPEPAAWALMVAGFGLVGGAMRRGARSQPA